MARKKEVTPQGDAWAQDVACAYRLFLARSAEAGAEALFAGMSLTDVARAALASPEFAARVAEPLRAGGFVAVEDAVREAAPALAVWAADALPLKAPGRVRAAQGWHGLIGVVLGDAGFAAAMGPAGGVADGGLEALAAAAQGRARDQLRVDLVGGIETCEERGLSGWAVNRVAPEEVLTLEAYADGRFVGAGTTGHARPDVAALHGTGSSGFFIGFEIGEGLDAVEIAVREAATGAPLGTVTLERDPRARLDALGEIGAELAAVKAALARIEAALPNVRAAASFSLASWAAYWDYFYRLAAGQVVAGGDPASPLFTVIIAADGDVGALKRALASVREQDFAGWELIVVAPEEAAGEDFRDALAQAGARAAATREKAAAAARGAWLVFVNGGVIAPDALSTIARATDGAALIYADGDAIGEDGRHLAPRLRSGFDAELLAQTPYFGDLTAISAAAFARAGGLAAGEEHDLWLRLAEAGERIVHLPRVLHHRLEPAPASPVRAPVAPDLAGVTARVIIPTRDRFDLLEKCLASLERSRAANQTRLEIVVVDNASDPATAPAALAALAALYPFELKRHAGPFNWSAINNAAAAGFAGEALVFLNNDTVVITPGWCDALVGAAMRADVGAAGARLLYADGTIQHGGMVIGERGLPVHEGVGTAGADGGYLGRLGLARNVVAVTGACLATRRAVFEDLGGFDAEAFAVTCNDADYCFRARVAGLKVLYEPAATLYHLESRSRGAAGLEDQARSAREEAAFLARWDEAADPFYNPHFERAAAPFTRLAPPPAV